MNYLKKQKFNILELIETSSNLRILFYEPHLTLGEIYKNYLRQKKYEIIDCYELTDLEDLISKNEPHTVIFSIHNLNIFSEIVKKIQRVSNKYSRLPILSYAYELPAEHVSNLMKAGIVSHVDRKFSKPKDLVFLIETILQKYK